MAFISPDVATRLKPDILAVVSKIYREVCHLEAGQNVLIISDARTLDHVCAALQGIAQSLGVEAIRIECRIPEGGATYQPTAKWPSMLVGAAERTGLIIDMAVGYAEFIVAAAKRGCRVVCPGGGIGGPFMGDILIRTMLHTDIHAIRRLADRIASLLEVVTERSRERLTIDITGLEVAAGDGYLWDFGGNKWKSDWGFLTPAQPGVLIPKGRGTGVVNVDGTILYHPVRPVPTFSYENHLFAFLT